MNTTKRPNQLLSPEEYLAEKNVKAVLNRIVMSLLETRPDNIERHIVNLLSTVSKTAGAAQAELFPSYGGGGAAQGGHGNVSNVPIGPKSVGRRQSAISPDVLRNVGQGVRRRGISSRLTSSTKVEIKTVPKDEATFNALIATTHKVDLFSFLQDEQRQALVSAMFKKEFHDRDVIIKEGDDPDNFYIIEKGNCIIYKKNPTTGKDEIVARSTAGQYFGELALISGSTRAATVVAEGDVTCWAIDQTTYLGLLKFQHGMKRQRYKQLLKNVSFLKVLKEYEILLVADALQSITAQPDEVIVRQGDNGDEFFIILNGECKVLKKDNDGNETEITRLKSGDYFGEVALLRNTPRTATIVAVGECKLIKLDRKSFHRLLGPCDPLFQENMKHYKNKKE